MNCQYVHEHKANSEDDYDEWLCGSIATQFLVSKISADHQVDYAMFCARHIIRYGLNSNFRTVTEDEFIAYCIHNEIDSGSI